MDGHTQCVRWRYEPPIILGLTLYLVMPNRRLSVGKFTELNKKKKTGAEEVNQCRLQIHLVCFNGK